MTLRRDNSEPKSVFCLVHTSLLSVCHLLWQSKEPMLQNRWREGFHPWMTQYQSSYALCLSDWGKKDVIVLGTISETEQAGAASRLLCA